MIRRGQNHEEMIDCLLTMAEVEWEHEKFFRELIVGHWMLRWFPLWDAPPPKEMIRDTMLPEVAQCSIPASRS